MSDNYKGSEYGTGTPYKRDRSLDLKYHARGDADDKTLCGNGTAQRFILGKKKLARVTCRMCIQMLYDKGIRI